MVVLHVPHGQIVRSPDIMVRPQDQTGVLPAEEGPQCLNLLGLGFLPGDHVVQPEHEESVGVGQYALVERGPESGLVDTLIHRNGVPGDLLDELLKRHPGPEEQFQCAA